MKLLRLVYLLWAIACVLSSGCDGTAHPEPGSGGSAQIAIRTSAVAAADIVRIVVTVSGNGISPDIVMELLDQPGDIWDGLINNIPEGVDRTITAQAYDSADTLIYSGAVTGVTIEGNETTFVTIQLQQVDPPTPFGNAVPIITSFVVSPMTVGLGDGVLLAVTASDANPEDTLAYEWTGTGGVFSNPTLPSTTWTAPTTPGTYTVTIAVADPHGAIAELSAEIEVMVFPGDAEILIIINNSPGVTGLTPTPTRIDVGESTELDLTAEDPEGDLLHFEWHADCVGSFDDIHQEDPTFTLDELTGDTCTLTATISDGNGGSNQASITIQTGPAVATTDVPLDCTGVIEFPDPALEAAVRDSIRKPTGDIYYDDIRYETILRASDAGISDLTGIQCLTGLTYLRLESNNLSDISPLSGLVNLNSLIIRFNTISDISALAGLSNLNRLWLSANNISDISPLSGLVNLTELSLSSNTISDFSPLSGLVNLAFLDLAHTGISDLTPLAGLTSLNELRLIYNTISDLSPLTGLSNLTTLLLESCSINDISPLSGLVNLTSLDLGINNISDISPLSGLVNLSTLFIYANDISDISALAGAVNLTTLILYNTNVSDLSPLSGLVNLRFLWLFANNISDISPLAENTGIDAGDHVAIYDNPIDCSDEATLNTIEILEERGVNLEHDC